MNAPRAATYGAQERARRASLDRADTHINNMLWMHNQARAYRPSAASMIGLSMRYGGARFRVHQERVSLSVGERTMFRPVIEVVSEVKGRKQWVTYAWLDHEEV